MNDVVICEPVPAPVAALGPSVPGTQVDRGCGSGPQVLLSRVSVNGFGIALGHPLGAARVLASLARELHRRKATYGLETMCIGGGQGLAAVFKGVA